MSEQDKKIIGNKKHLYDETIEYELINEGMNIEIKLPYVSV